MSDLVSYLYWERGRHLALVTADAGPRPDSHNITTIITWPQTLADLHQLAFKMTEENLWEINHHERRNLQNDRRGSLRKHDERRRWLRASCHLSCTCWLVGYDDWSQISDCHNNMGVPWPWQRSGDIIVTHRTFLRILQKPDTVCTVSSDDLKRMMPQKLIFDGPGSGDESTRWADAMITIKLISISKMPKAIKPDTQERGLRESVQKWGEINL